MMIQMKPFHDFASLYTSHRFLNDCNIVAGSKDVSLGNQQPHTFPTDWCTNFDLHFVGLDPDLKTVSLVLDE